MKKSYHHGDLRQAAIDKALELIQKRGEVTFTLREIAIGLKVSHTAVYRHFQSKQDLLSYIAEDGYVKLLDLFTSTIGSKKSTKAKLNQLSHTYIEFAIENPGHYRCMFHQELRCSKDLRQELIDIGEQAFAILSEIISQGVKEQTFRKGIPQVLAQSVWSAMHGFCVLYLDGQFHNENVTTKELTAAIENHIGFIQYALR